MPFVHWQCSDTCCARPVEASSGVDEGSFPRAVLPESSMLMV